MMTAPLRTRIADTINEKLFQGLVTEYAGLNGWATYHTRDSRGSDPGFPDLVLVRDRVIFAELKAARGRVTNDQRAWAAALEAAGAVYYLWRPADWPEIETVLR